MGDFVHAQVFYAAAVMVCANDGTHRKDRPCCRHESLKRRQ
jgi:hypothetical protein